MRETSDVRGRCSIVDGDVEEAFRRDGGTGPGRDLNPDDLQCVNHRELVSSRLSTLVTIVPLCWTWTL
jgi:hypothetical protein